MFCSNTTEKTKLEKYYLGARVLAPKPVYQSPKWPGYFPARISEAYFSNTYLLSIAC